MVLRNVFNEQWYLQQNPDVAEAVQQGLISAETHFNLFGKHEGRAPGPLFDPEFYLKQNPDVAAAVEAGLITAYEHFEQFGVSEARNPVPYFDVEFYLQQNPDIAAAVEQGLISAVDHFLQFGQTEPRPLSPFFDLGAYMAANPDVADAVAAGAMSPLDHLLTFGFTEGRDLGNGVSLAQFQNDPTFQAALSGGGNVLDALERVAEVAPFLPTFQPPANWEPPANTPVPVDFVPPAGTTLVIPPTVVVPPDVELPDTFEPAPAPEPRTPEQPAPEPPTPTPPAGGGGGGESPPATFNVRTDDDGILTFEGTATGPVSLSLGGETLIFTRDGIDAQARPGISQVKTIEVPTGVTLIASQNDVSQVSHINLEGTASLKVKTAFEALSEEGRQALESANIANVSVNGASGPKATWDNVVTESASAVDKFKLFWVTGDEKYYELLYSEVTPDKDDFKAVNDANLQLGELYIEYLEGGGAPILDIVQTKVGSEPNFAARQQSLHDNLLGNLNASAIASRVNAGTLTDPQFDSESSAAKYAPRPIFDGILEKPKDKEASIVWDLAHGLPRSDAADMVSSNVYIIRSGDSTDLVLQYESINEAVDHSQDGDTIFLGYGIFKEDVVIDRNDLSIIFSEKTVVEGGFVVTGNVEGLQLSGHGEILNGLSTNPVAGSAGKGIYLQRGADVSIEGITFRLSGEPDGQQRAIEAESGESIIVVEDAAFLGAWLTGIYANQGNNLRVVGSDFEGGMVGIGTDGPESLVVKGSYFDTILEGIGLTKERVIGNVDISGNTYSEDIIAIANHGEETGLTELIGKLVVVVAEGQSVQSAINLIDSLEGHGQVILGVGQFSETLKVNGSLTLLGQGEGSILNGSIRINDPSDANKVVSDIRLEGFKVDAPAGVTPIIALSNHDKMYNTEDLHIINMIVSAEAQHGIGLFDVKNAILQNLIIQLDSNGSGSQYYAVESLGLSDALLQDIYVEGFATNDYGSVNVWSLSGYEANSSIELVNVGGYTGLLFEVEVA